MNTAMCENKYLNSHQHLKNCFTTQTVTANWLEDMIKKKKRARAEVAELRDSKEDKMELLTKPSGQDQHSTLVHSY